jgi:hypothetical protein
MAFIALRDAVKAIKKEDLYYQARKNTVKYLGSNNATEKLNYSSLNLFKATQQDNKKSHSY